MLINKTEKDHKIITNNDMVFFRFFYHLAAHNMEGAIDMSESDAKAQGYAFIVFNKTFLIVFKFCSNVCISFLSKSKK